MDAKLDRTLTCSATLLSSTRVTDLFFNATPDPSRSPATPAPDNQSQAAHQPHHPPRSQHLSSPPPTITLFCIHDGMILRSSISRINYIHRIYDLNANAFLPHVYSFPFSFLLSSTYISLPSCHRPPAMAPNFAFAYPIRHHLYVTGKPSVPQCMKQTRCKKQESRKTTISQSGIYHTTTETRHNNINARL